jgi:peptidoglycan-associated lipoprotein
VKTSRIPALLPVVLIAALSLNLAGCKRNPGSETDPNAGDGSTEQVENTHQFDPNANPANPDPGTNTNGTDVDGPGAELERRLRPVFFHFDRSDLTQESRDTLTENARVLRETPGFDIVIEGHCDERGTNEYNLALGDRRARAARDFLVTSGLPASRFSIVSYGEERPFEFGHDERSWSQNRRAHFKVARR